MCSAFQTAITICIDNVGERIPESTKYCYPDYGKTDWLPFQCGQLEELLDPLNEIDQDERQSIN